MRRSHRVDDLESGRTLLEQEGANDEPEGESRDPALFLDISVRRKEKRGNSVIWIKCVTDLKSIIYRQGADYEISKIYVRTLGRLDVVEEIYHISDSETGRLGLVYLTESRHRIFADPGVWDANFNIEKSVYSFRRN